MSTNNQFAVITQVLLLLAVIPDSDLGDEWLTSDAIAASVNTNPVVIRRLIAELEAAGMVNAAVGKHGGYRLARPAKQITLRDIYAATGNPPIFAFKTAPPAPRCPVGSKMKKVLNPVFDGVQRAVNDHLSKMTLADLQAQIA